ncbi:MAG: hypothetical protein CME26_10515 [Gemmatimonadetes bacterium]|nr:hypothetical protein [Gemmatimonadota bacterium]
MIDSFARAERRGKMAGYILTAVTVVVWLCWWAISTQGSRRFRGIEKFRGAVPELPEAVRLT